MIRSQLPSGCSRATCTRPPVPSAERELGEQLLDRSGRTVRPTEAGAAVLPHARAAVDELTGLLCGHLTVGTVTAHQVDLPGRLAFAWPAGGADGTAGTPAGRTLVALARRHLHGRAA
jgi:hypothetical protein